MVSGWSPRLYQVSFKNICSVRLEIKFQELEKLKVKFSFRKRNFSFRVLTFVYPQNGNYDYDNFKKIREKDFLKLSKIYKF